MAKKTENEVKETKKEAAVMDEAAKEKVSAEVKRSVSPWPKRKRTCWNTRRSATSLRTCS